jgi:GTP-binding protein
VFDWASLESDGETEAAAEAGAESGLVYAGNDQAKTEESRRKAPRGTPPPAAAPAVLTTGSVSTAPVIRVSKGGVPYRETRSVLVDLDEHGTQFLVARGGRGGTGNKGSQLTYAETLHSVSKPHLSGEQGEVRLVEFELKTIADVGLVGFPNAGKSSFLGAVSKARPKVAAYPFTTMHPTVGNIRFRDSFDLSVADIPGLIEGAHENRGLGHEFLRHIERTKVLAYVVDASGCTGKSMLHAANDPVADLRTLQWELRLYDPALPRRPSLVVANKCDLPGAAEGVRRLREATSLPVVTVSCVRREGMALAMDSLRWLVETHERLREQERKADAARQEAEEEAFRDLLKR